MNFFFLCNFCFLLTCTGDNMVLRVYVLFSLCTALSNFSFSFHVGLLVTGQLCSFKYCPLAIKT